MRLFRSSSRLELLAHPLEGIVFWKPHDGLPFSDIGKTMSAIRVDDGQFPLILVWREPIGVILPVLPLLWREPL